MAIKSKTVWQKDIDCDGTIYHTKITKPIGYTNGQWQIALHVKIGDVNLHDYDRHCFDGWDTEILDNQVCCIFGRLLKRLPNLETQHHKWYRKMQLDEFNVGNNFDFEI